MSPLHLQIICFLFAIYIEIKRHYFQTWFYDVYRCELWYINSVESLHYASSNENEKSFSSSNILMYFVVWRSCKNYHIFLYLIKTIRNFYLHLGNLLDLFVAYYYIVEITLHIFVRIQHKTLLDIVLFEHAYISKCVIRRSP